MTVQAIAFDLEGTVIDVEEAHHRGHLAAASEYGVEMSIEEAYTKLEHFIGGPDAKVCEDIWNLLDPDTRRRCTVQDVLTRVRFHYHRLIETMAVEPRPGFLEFYEQIRRLGIAATIGSLTVANQALVLLDRSGLRKRFGDANLVLAEHVKALKPAPDVYLRTAEISNVHPRDQLVFEDSPRGVQAAHAAGSRAVGMPVVINGAAVGALVDAGVVRLFYDWRDINACALISNL